MKLKVCGITNKENAVGVSSLAPDYMGFIFYKPSPRDVSSRMDEMNINLIDKRIQKVAVFVNEKITNVLRIAEKYHFDLVQLHGDETPSECKGIRNYVRVVKAFRISDVLPINLDEYIDCCDFFLFDSSGKNYGGNGTAFDHSILENYNGKLPFFLSGGISLNSMDSIEKLKNPKFYCVDLNSRFETSPGIKDINMLNEFFKKFKQ